MRLGGHGRRGVRARNASLRAGLIAGTALVIAISAWLGASATWRSGPVLHTVIEMLATFAAAFAGTVAIVRYFSKRSTQFLFIGTGFLAAAVLDGLHITFSDAIIPLSYPSSLDAVTAWSWLISRTVLAIFLLLTWLGWEAARQGMVPKVAPRALFSLTALAICGCVLTLLWVPLPDPHINDAFLHRPLEMIPGLIFAVSFAGQLRRGAWRHDMFEFLLVLSLLVAAGGQLVFMPYSRSLGDAEFDLGHLCKLISYVLVLAGLIYSMYGLFRQAEESADRLAHKARELAESETRTRAIIDNAGEGILTVDHSGRIVTFNPTAEQIFGYTREQVLGRDIKLLMPARFWEVADGFRTRFAAEQPTLPAHSFRQEVVGRRADGTHFPMELALSAYRLRSGAHFTGLVRDLTEERRQQAILDRTLALQTAILAGTTYSIIATDTSGTIVSFNRAAERMLGYYADEVVGRATPTLIHDRAEIVARAQQLSRELGCDIEPGFDVFIAKAREGAPEEQIWTYVRKDGTTFKALLSVAALTDPQGTVTGYVGISSDITARLEAERRLRDSEQRFRALVESAPIGIFATDRNGDFIQVNTTWVNLTGLNDEQSAAAGWVRAIHRDDRERVVAAWRAAVRDQHPFSEEFRIERLDGSEIWVLGQSVPLRSGHVLEGYLGTVTDISERKQIERMKGEFISTVSHELRTPLTSLRGALGLLHATPPEQIPDALASLVDIAHRNSERLARLVNDILEVEKIESEKLAIRLEKVDMNEVAEHALDLDQPLADRYNCRFEFAPAPAEAWIRADPDRLMQVISNLLSNAAKFSPTGAAVRIAVETDAEHIRLTVTDQGTGIPDEFRERIFGRFAQANVGGGVRKEGSGLGLSIARALTVRMGGRIDFVSAAGGPTTFLVEFPLLRDEAHGQ